LLKLKCSPRFFPPLLNACYFTDSFHANITNQKFERCYIYSRMLKTFRAISPLLLCFSCSFLGGRSLFFSLPARCSAAHTAGACAVGTLLPHCELCTPLFKQQKARSKPNANNNAQTHTDIYIYIYNMIDLGFSPLLFSSPFRACPRSSPSAASSPKRSRWIRTSPPSGVKFRAQISHTASSSSTCGLLFMLA